MPLFAFPGTVNERAARLVGAGVATMLLAAILTGSSWAIPVIALGFALRVVWGPRFSPLGRAAVAVAKRAFEVVPTSGAPKQFAQAIGLTCTVAATALFAADLPTAAWAICGMVVVFATLEASLGFCAGCWMFGQLQRLGVFPPDVCVDCARLASERT